MLLRLSCLILAFLALVSLARCQSKLKTIDFDCTRQCDSHFSGPECWSTTLRYFSNDLMKSIVLYKNIIQLANKDENYLLEKAFEATNKYVSIDSNLAQFIFATPSNVTREVVQKLSNSNITKNNVSFESDCPKSCQEQSLVLWRSLYGLFMGLTLATLIFLIAYTALLKLQFNKFNQKLTSATLNTS